MIKQKESLVLWRDRLQRLCDEVFRVSVVTYVGLLVLEEIREGFVSYHFSFAMLFTIVLISGFFANVLPSDATRKKNSPRLWEWKYTGLSFFLAVIASLVIYLTTKSMGRISIVLGILAFFILGTFFLFASADESDAT